MSHPYAVAQLRRAADQLEAGNRLACQEALRAALDDMNTAEADAPEFADDIDCDLEYPATCSEEDCDADPDYA